MVDSEATGAGVGIGRRLLGGRGSEQIRVAKIIE